MKKIIGVFVVAGVLIAPALAGKQDEDLVKFKKERAELISRINEYEGVLQNLKYRVLQLDALIDYVQKNTSDKIEKK